MSIIKNPDRVLIFFFIKVYLVTCLVKRTGFKCRTSKNVYLRQHLGHSFSPD